MMYIKLACKIVNRSKNLAGIQSYKAKHCPVSCIVWRVGWAARFEITFDNGAIIKDRFESFEVCSDWMTRNISKYCTVTLKG